MSADPTEGAAAVAAVGDALARLAPAGVRTGCRAIAASDVGSLFPVEAVAVARAVPRRRHEFATGRVLLRQLVGADVPIDVAADRSPVLPAGVVGSLAHAGSLAVAAACGTDVAAALGVDVEPATALDDGLAAVILRPDEGAMDAHLAFTLKEAVYKAWSGCGGGMLEHHDVRLTVRRHGWFDAVEARSCARFVGRYAAAAGHWLALVVVPRAHPGAT